MRILPIVGLQHLTDEEIEEHECSDRIWLSKSEFEHWITVTEVGIITVLQLTNGAQQTALGVPYNVHCNEDSSIVYVPSWMYNRLDLDEEVTLARIQPPMCTGFTIQPHTSDHLIVEDPEMSLRNAFENYSCLMPGIEIPLWIGYPFYVTIACLKPLDEPACIRNCEVELELMPPLDAPIQDAFKEEVVKPASSIIENEIVHETVGIKLGGTVSHKSRRELAAEAALRRAQK